MPVGDQVDVLILGGCPPSRARGNSTARAAAIVHIQPAEAGCHRRRCKLVLRWVAMQTGQTDAGAGTKAGEDGTGGRVDDGGT